MWILSKDGKALFNTDSIEDIYIPASGDAAVRASFSSTSKDLTLAKYDTEIETKMAMRHIYGALKRGELATEMPDKSRIEELLRPYEAKERAANGKKTVRRGGS